MWIPVDAAQHASGAGLYTVDGDWTDSFEPLSDGKYRTETAMVLMKEKGIVNPECWRICLTAEKKL